jgi:hypothetical protein
VFPLRLCDRCCHVACTEAERVAAAPLLVRVPRPGAVAEHDHGHGRAGVRRGVQLHRQPHVPMPGVRALPRRLSRACCSISRPPVTSSPSAASWSHTPTTSPRRPCWPMGSRCSCRSSAAAPPGTPARTRRCSTRSARGTPAGSSPPPSCRTSRSTRPWSV